MHILLLLVSILCFHTIAAAQTNSPQATKLDEFGDVYPTDAAARLDFFAIELQKQPSANAFIVGYRSHHDLPGITGRRLDWMKNYLISLRGIDAQRIKTVDGGETSCLTYQFWLVPPGTAPVPRNDAWSRAFDNLEVARKFDEYRWDAPHAIPDSFSVDYAGGLEGFADALRKEPRSFGYLIAYSEYRFDLVGEPERLVRRATIDPPGTALKYLNQLKRILVKNLKVSPAKVRLLDGGYRDSRAIEFWIVPRGAYAPVPTPNMLPKRRRVQ